jgi:hypothetical protein
MSKCDLMIEIESPTTPRAGGEIVRGKVIVNSHAEVRCNGLSIQTNWKTQGRGNSTEGTPHSKELFVGDWSPGQRAEYPFEIPLHTWPPTYHGNSINVDHYVIATANLPWAFDPSVSVPIEVIVNQPSAQPDTRPIKLQAKSGIVLGLVFAIIMIGILMIVPVAVKWGLAALLIGLTGLAIVRWWMPNWMLGKLDLQWDEIALPGQTLKGRLTLDPKRNLLVGPIEAFLVGSEIATSGSGKSRKTHSHELFRKRQVVADRLELNAGLKTEVSIELEVPEHAPATMKLGDNEIRYFCGVSVGISRWPDWQRGRSVCVCPHPGGLRSVTSFDSTPLEETYAPPSIQSSHTGRGIAVENLSTSDNLAASDNPIAFDEFVDLLWNVRDSEDDRDRLIDAVGGIPLDVSAILQQRLPDSIRDNYAEPGDHVVSAHAVDPPLPLLIFAGEDAGDEFADPQLELWQGRAEVLGWDDSSNRLKLQTLERRKYSK